MTNNHKGFTLTEILIVVTIIVVLGIAILVSINPIAQIFKGYDARRKADLSEIKIALEGYYSDHDCYPLFPLNASGKPTYTCDSDILDPYLKTMPCDPNSNEPYTFTLQPADTTCPQQFAVYAEITSFFDTQANSIPYCPRMISASSPNITEVNLINGCSEKDFADTYYGCNVSGNCVVVSEGTIPSCAPSTREPDCDAGTDQNNSEAVNQQIIFEYCSDYRNICNPK